MDNPYLLFILTTPSLQFTLSIVYIAKHPSYSMSRVTPIPPPVKKSFQQFIRSISSSSKAGHPSPLLDSRARINAYLPRAVKDLKAECSKRSLKISGSKAEVMPISHNIPEHTADHSRSLLSVWQPTTSSQLMPTILLEQAQAPLDPSFQPFHIASFH